MTKATKFLPHLKVAVLPNFGLFEVQKNHSTGEITLTGGVEEAFLNMLSHYVGFTYSVNVPDDLAWGTPTKDGNWTGLVGMVLRGEADMALSKLGLEERRRSVVDFSYPYFFEGMNFGKELPGKLSTATAFVRPFSTKLWLSFFIYLLVMPVVFRLLLKTKYSLASLNLRVFGTLLNQPTAMRINLSGEMILALSFYTTALIITSGYISNLLSFLTLPLLKEDIRTIEQLSIAVKAGTIQCTTFKGTFTKGSLIKSHNEIVRLIGESMDEEMLIKPTKESVVDFFRKTKGVLIGSKDDIRLIINEIFISDESFFSVSCAIAINENFPFKEKLNTIIHRVWSSGLYVKSLEKYFPKVEAASEKNAEAKRLKLEDLFGIFLLLFCGLLLSATVFFFEVISYPIKRRMRTGE